MEETDFVRGWTFHDVDKRSLMFSEPNYGYLVTAFVAMLLAAWF